MQVLATDAFPTPPSSASTPPAVISEDQPPPQKRARYNTSASIRSGDTISRDVSVGSSAVAVEVRIPRIRIKMSETTHERRISTRVLGKNNVDQEEGIEMEESDDVTMTPATTTLEQSDAVVGEELRWEDQEVREMVEQEESWRVIGLSNVGNTCFTNAILQVLGYIYLGESPLMTRQTEVLGEYFIRRYEYIPPSLTAITNPLTSADLTSRSSRSKTRRNQVVDQAPPPLATLYPFFPSIAKYIGPSVPPSPGYCEPSILMCHPQYTVWG